ncbi:MAG: ATP-dependent helicase C-terminal domain-containing protein [Sandaracinaceae bacterium]|nr:ATP-dependent helicase C-terminal domain-containing protein [Sandaracinaceae bacterium]
MVFLPGAREIRESKALLEPICKHHGYELVCLHGDLPPSEQEYALQGGKKRRVILSTNVAETSITIDGVSCVIDSGLERRSFFSPWQGVPELRKVPIAKSSAIQRAGRAGRTAKGRAIRLYSQSDYESRANFPPPEIHRSDLSEMVLILAKVGITEPESFAFFDPPPPAFIEHAKRSLRALSAIDEKGKITPTGEALLRLPVAPRLGRVALEAARLGKPREGAQLAAVLAERDFRIARRTAIDSRRHQHETPLLTNSDALDRFEAFTEILSQGPSHTPKGIDPYTFRSIAQIAKSLEVALRGLKVACAASTPSTEEVLLRSLLAGYSDRVVRRQKPGSNELLLADGGQGRIAPQSGVWKSEWMVVIDGEEKNGVVECIALSHIEVDWLLESFPERMREQREVVFDRKKEKVECRLVLSYEGIPIEETRLEVEGEEVASVLAKAVLEEGIGRFLDEKVLEAWKERIRIARIFDPTIPLLDDALIQRTLLQVCADKRSFREIEQCDLLATILGEIGQEAINRVEQLAPQTVSLPGRRRVPVHYESGKPPWIESAIQDFFGASEGPRLGSIPIVLHLLAPNRRPVQVTTDLRAFWERHYPSLRKQLSRQYPKHFWPEDPLSISPPSEKHRPRS